MAIDFDLRGKRILVIGASSGVGRAIGWRAGRSGARVAFAARRRERLDEAVAKAESEALALPCDVTVADDCQRVVDDTVRGFGGLDALVYCAGMSRIGMLAEADADDWRRLLDVNLVGAALVTAAAIPHLHESQGRALFISSYTVRQSLPGLGLYRVSKVALDALIEDFRSEHSEIDFTRVVVGNTVGTEFADGWSQQELRRALEVWVERNLFPAATMMSLDVLAESIVSVLAVRGYVDDIAIMPRTRDPKAGG